MRARPVPIAKPARCRAERPPLRELKGPLGPVLSGWLALAAAVHLYFGGTGFPEPVAMRAFHLLALVPPIFLLWPARASSPTARPSLPD